MYWIWENFFSVTGNDKYGSNSYVVLQPNVFYTWSNGIYAGIEPEWQYAFHVSVGSLLPDSSNSFIVSKPLPTAPPALNADVMNTVSAISFLAEFISISTYFRFRGL